MSEWKKVKLGEIAQIIDGDRGKNYPKNNEFFDKGFCLFLNTGNVTQDGFSFESNQFITEEKDSSLRKGKLTRGDLVYTTRGTVGNIAFYDRNVQFHNVRINSGMVILRANEQYVIASFLYQLLKSDATRRYIKSFCTGSAQPQLPIKNLSQILLDFPPKDVQHRIATILSRYDSLIENYQKQIKLLEEAAQRLYKEWFVDLRFPGHENIKIVNGVPEGWEKKTLDFFCNVFTGKKNANQGVPNGEYKFFTCGDTPLLINSFIYDGPAIIISGNGSYTGRTTFYEGKFDLYQRTYACTLKDTNNRDLIYGLYEIVKCELTNRISGGTHGAAIPYIVMSDLTKFDFLFNESILHIFSTTMKNFLSISLKLSNNIRLLTEARDRLLPKLMSGEIAV